MASVQEKLAAIHTDAGALKAEILRGDGLPAAWGEAADRLAARARKLVAALNDLPEEEQVQLLAQAEEIQAVLVLARERAAAAPEHEQGGASLLERIHRLNSKAYDLAVAIIERTMLPAAAQEEAADLEAQIRPLSDEARGGKYAAEANRLLSEAILELTFVQMDGKAPVSSRIAQFQRGG